MSSLGLDEEARRLAGDTKYKGKERSIYIGMVRLGGDIMLDTMALVTSQRGPDSTCTYIHTRISDSKHRTTRNLEESMLIHSRTLIGFDMAVIMFDVTSHLMYIYIGFAAASRCQATTSTSPLEPELQEED